MMRGPLQDQKRPGTTGKRPCYTKKQYSDAKLFSTLLRTLALM